MRLYDVFPEHVEIDSVRYNVVTDFRDWIMFCDLITDASLNDFEKIECMCEWFIDERPYSADDIISALTTFLVGSDNSEVDVDKGESDSSGHRQVISYEYDYDYILSGFIECYGIDLSDIDYMHWWKFKALINGLNEKTELKQRMIYRGMDASKIKDKYEKKRILEIQKNIAIPQKFRRTIAVSDYTIGNAFA